MARSTYFGIDNQPWKDAKASKATGTKLKELKASIYTHYQVSDTKALKAKLTEWQVPFSKGQLAKAVGRGAAPLSGRCLTNGAEHPQKLLKFCPTAKALSKLPNPDSALPTPRTEHNIGDVMQTEIKQFLNTIKKFEDEREYTTFVTWLFNGSTIGQRMQQENERPIPEHWKTLKRVLEDMPMEKIPRSIQAALDDIKNGTLS